MKFNRMLASQILFVFSLLATAATTKPYSVLKIENPFGDCADAVAVLEELTASGAGDVGLTIDSGQLLAQMVVANKIYKSGGDIAAAKEVQQYFGSKGIDQRLIEPVASQKSVEEWVSRAPNVRTITTASVFTATNQLWGLGDPRVPRVDQNSKLIAAQKAVLIAVQNSDSPEAIRKSLTTRYSHEGLPTAAFELPRLRKDVLTSVISEIAAEGNMQNRMAVERRAKLLYGFTLDEIRSLAARRIDPLKESLTAYLNEVDNDKRRSIAERILTVPLAEQEASEVIDSLERQAKPVDQVALIRLLLGASDSHSEEFLWSVTFDANRDEVVKRAALDALDRRGSIDVSSARKALFAKPSTNVATHVAEMMCEWSRDGNVQARNALLELARANDVAVKTAVLNSMARRPREELRTELWSWFLSSPEEPLRVASGRNLINLGEVPKVLDSIKANEATLAIALLQYVSLGPSMQSKEEQETTRVVEAMNHMKDRLNTKTVTIAIEKKIEKLAQEKKDFAATIDRDETSVMSNYVKQMVDSIESNPQNSAISQLRATVAQAQKLLDANSSNAGASELKVQIQRAVKILDNKEKQKL